MAVVFGLGPTELIIILVIVLVLFGGSKLPKLARSLGEAQKEFKQGIDDDDKPTEATPPPAAAATPPPAALPPAEPPAATPCHASGRIAAGRAGHAAGAATG